MVSVAMEMILGVKGRCQTKIFLVSMDVNGCYSPDRHTLRESNVTLDYFLFLTPYYQYTYYIEL